VTLAGGHKERVTPLSAETRSCRPDFVRHLDSWRFDLRQKTSTVRSVALTLRGSVTAFVTMEPGRPPLERIIVASVCWDRGAASGRRRRPSRHGFRVVPVYADPAGSWRVERDGWLERGSVRCTARVTIAESCFTCERNARIDDLPPARSSACGQL
jgi:hypothetical protein